MPSNRAVYGIFVRREAWRLSKRGWLLLLATLFCGAIAVRQGLYPFLDVSSPAQGECLIVEGWISQDNLKDAMAILRNPAYKRIYTTGGPFHDDWTGENQATFAHWGASKLNKLGFTNNEVQAIPCPLAQVDRTYTSALAAKDWFQTNGVQAASVDVLSVGPHARRTRLMFQKAFGGTVKVGVIALVPKKYDPEHWWRSSEGAKEVLGEAVGYLYARFLF